MNNSTKSAEFLAKFHEERNAIQAQIDKLQNATSVSSLDLQPLSAKITSLGTSFTMERATEFLPAYDQRLCNEQMDLLESGLETLRSRAGSRGKFSFKKKAPSAASTPAPTPASTPASASVSTTPAPAEPMDVKPDVRAESAPVERPMDTEPWSNATRYGRQFGNIRDAIISASSFFRPEEADKKSLRVEITLVSLRNCLINLLPAADPQGKEIEVTALYARDLESCVIIAGHIPGSVRLEKVRLAIFVGGCHQLRMENCESVAVYSAIKTAPAIENSTLIGFGPYPNILPYPLPDENKAHEVQDFSSVGAGSSPNWKALGDGSNIAKHFINMFNMDPAGWPNKGQLLPLRAEDAGHGMISECEDAIDLLSK
ncbi:hypothetical protein M407DRAFT_30290 [Tulasnella calospora MUT 4182]|uniref:C-CAP/cofactor C-like domain-containing protein n=1 Tax=Tulasnella calospora MUT 4182 TaxID=1051891 RepID=A0A0C3PY07_9AGAM|nr:hypothetical protein M407DRAFT_30290 [Tulasnella calospora MUT 4182]